jgi:Tfp pilus assembly protein PilE
MEAAYPVDPRGRPAVTDHQHRLDPALGMQIVMLVLSTIVSVAVVIYFAYQSHVLDDQVRAQMVEMRAIRSDVEQYQAKVAGYMWKRDRDWEPHILAIPVEPK